MSGLSSWNNHYCSVPQCKSWAKKKPELSFHLFPKAEKRKTLVVNKLGVQELVDVRKMWIKNLKIRKPVSKFMKVCSLHFTEDDYFTRGVASDVKRRKLKTIAVPSQKLPVGTCESSSEEPGPSSKVQRKNRLRPITATKMDEERFSKELCYPKVEIKMEEVEVDFEDLHHSVDIKDEKDSEGFSQVLPRSDCPKIEIKSEEIEFNSEDLHHSVDIKEEPPFSVPEVVYVSDLEICKHYKCNICGYQSLHKRHLYQHSRIHTGKKPFACEFCDYRSATKSVLKEHVKTHTGEKPFACSACAYRSARKCDLLNHFKIHTGEKPFACIICTYKTAYQNNFNCHLKTHTGEKPFTCAVCNAKFALKGTLQRHLKTHVGKSR